MSPKKIFLDDGWETVQDQESSPKIFFNNLQFFVDEEGYLSIGNTTTTCFDKEAISLLLIYGIQFDMMFYPMGQLQLILMDAYMLKKFKLC